MAAEPKVITKKQARRQIDLLCSGLVILVLLECALRIGKPYLLPLLPVFFAGADTDTVFLIAEIAVMAVVCIPFIIASFALKLNLADYMRSPHHSLGQTLSLICIGIALRFLSASLSQLVYLFSERSTLEYAWIGQFVSRTYIINNVLYAVLFVLLRPVFHEIIFRGIIQRHLGHYGRYFGVLGSAFLFALCQPDLPGFAAMFFLGWYLSTVTLYSHSILPSIRISIALNLFLWLLFIIPERAWIIVMVFLVIVYVTAALYIFRLRGRNIVRYGATESTLWKLLVTSPSVIILIIVFTVSSVWSILH